MGWEFKVWLRLAMRMLANAWKCQLSMNRGATKFLFESPTQPTLCVIHTGLKFPDGWDRSDFGDFVKMRWERCLGVIEDGFQPLSALRENYRELPPYYAVHMSNGVPLAYLIDNYQIPCEASKQDIMEIIVSRYSDGVGGRDFPGIEGVHLGLHQIESGVRLEASSDTPNVGLDFNHFGELFPILYGSRLDTND